MMFSISAGFHKISSQKDLHVFELAKLTHKRPSYLVVSFTRYLQRLDKIQLAQMLGLNDK